MNWDQRIKSERFYALLYGGIFVSGIAAAVWSFISGDRLGAVVVAVTAVPFALFSLGRLKNRRLIRLARSKHEESNA